MQVTLWPIENVIPYARNARKIPDSAIDKVAASIQEFGFRQPIVVDSDGVIIAGHTRLLAAQKLGLKEVPVHVAEGLTKAQIKAYRLMDNRSHQDSSWDEELLGIELADLNDLEFDLELTGFEEEELDRLMAETTEGLTDDDAAPEVPEVAVTVPGDLWILGKHRVLCGDSTSIGAVERLMDGQKADMVFTDPPYGINIVKRAGDSTTGVGGGAKPYGTQGIVGGGGSAGAMYPFGGVEKGVVGGAGIVKPKLYAPVINDESTGTAEAFYHCALASGITDLIIFGGNYFTSFLPPSACWVIWDKQNSGNFADVEMAWTSFDRGAKLYAFMWNGLSRQGDRKTELATRVHPTQKPVGLIEKIFGDFAFQNCFDGFLGSGSTLIACEKTRRSCFGMELSPAYCDVIVKRWQDFTGKIAHLEDGRTLAQLESERCASTCAA